MRLLDSPNAGTSIDVSGPARCQACGRRVASAHAGCPEHGPALQLDSSEEAEVSDILISSRPPLPFPGYRTHRLLGRGGFGAVFAATMEDSDQPVAIKLARSDRPDAGRRLDNEIKALLAVGPPHVPAVFGQGSLGPGLPYVVMEQIEAPTLAEILVLQGGPTPPGEAVALTLSTLRAVEAIHAAGYVHCDLKPENIFVDDQKRAKVIDLGLIIRAAADRDALESSTENMIPGTAEYMAPEQCEGRLELDVRADIYAMGVILFELLAGRPPFFGPPAAVRESHQSRRPPRLRSLVPISRALEDIVLRCLSKERAERFESAAALRATLSLWLTGGASQDPQATPLPGMPMSLTRAKGGQSRRTVGLLCFEAELDRVALQQKLERLGGQLGHAAGNRFVAVFSQEASDNPARLGLQAGKSLLQEGVFRRALLDLGPVMIQPRPDGSRRFLIPAPSRAEPFPVDEGERGLFLTPAARAVLADVSDASALPIWDRKGRGNGPEIAPEHAAMKMDVAPLIGRDAILDALVESARKAARRLPSIVTVIGEAGYGKSSLRSALLRELYVIGGQASVIDLRAGESGLAFGGDQIVREILRQALDLPLASPLDGGQALLLRRLGRAKGADLWRSVALSMGWISEDATELRALEAAPGALRSALTVAAGEALRRRAARSPLFVVLDDAHFADDVALSALEYAALAEAGAPLWICALGRPTFEQPRPSWGERAGHRETHRLGPLDPASAAALCRHHLRPVEDVPSSAIERLIERTQGIPLLLVELIRGLRRGGIVRRQPKGDGFYLATDELDRVPDLPLIEWLAHSEIDTLAPALASHARLIALLGADVTATEVEGVLQRLDRQGSAAPFPLDATVGIQRLLTAGVLVRRPGGLSFRHALVREAVTCSIGEPLRTQVHLAVVEYYRHAEGLPAIRRLSQLALHAAEAGLGDIAESAYLKLAERARARHAYMEAERLYSRAIEQSTEESAHLRAAYRGRGLMRGRLGRYHDALADLGRARALCRREGDTAAEIELLLDEATALDWMDEFKSSEEQVLKAKELSARVISRALEARLSLGLGRSLHRFSRDEEAREMLERAAEQAESLGDEGYETWVIALLLLGFMLPGMGRTKQAKVVTDRAIALCTAHGDTLHLVSAVNNRALLRACLGDKEGMVADLERVIALGRELGQGFLEFAGHFNLGEYLYLMDDLSLAEPHVERAVAIERRRLGDAGRPVAALLSARLQLYRGDEAEAREAVQRIRARQADARQERQPDALMVPAEDVLCSMIELATRAASAEEWAELELRSARFSVGQEHLEVLEMRAISALRRGRATEAKEQLDKAIAAAFRIPNVMRKRLRWRWVEAQRGKQKA